MTDEHDAAVQPADRQAAVEPAEGHAEERGGGEVVGEGHQGMRGILMDDAIHIGYKATARDLISYVTLGLMKPPSNTS